MGRFGTLFISIFLVSLLSIGVFAEGHHSFEHAEEMRTSGRVDWMEYGPEAYERALKENKPIFLMLTAPSWCYWCHVYTSSDYVYNDAIYPIINDNFVPIYVDADKRQDLTRQFLEGGWPSTTIFSPDRVRLFGYSGPRPIPWMQANLQQAVDFVSNNQFEDSFAYSYQKENQRIPTAQDLNQFVNSMAGNILGTYDSEHGGFGTGQKFPQGRALDFSLDLYELTNDRQWLDLVENTLANQYTKVDELESNYNLFDPIEGGFHRYGTSREWSPPHYEKMLYDNARLLKAYVHLLQVNPDNEIATEVVQKNLGFIEENWIDSNGGFYGNSDVHGEHHYYAKNPRPSDKPRVEKTIYTDWNADAVVAYLHLYQVYGDEQYKDIVVRTLNRINFELITKGGALHYLKDDGEKGVRGTLLDNAHALLMFVEGYEVLEDENYLDVAKSIADYSIEHLYDWHSGGFFERNSPDPEIYAPGEHVNLGKPSQDNGVIAYALLKLYTFTNDPVYLNAGIKTLGNRLGRIGSLDRGYYYARAAQVVNDNQLLQSFSNLQTQIAEIEAEALNDYWLDRLLERQEAGFNVTDVGIETLEGPLLLLLIVALLAGFISFISPCTLPIIPAYFAYMLSTSKKNVKGMTLFFHLGLAVVFALLGMSATVIGGFLRSHIADFTTFAGLLILVFGFYIAIGKGFTGIKVKQTKPRSYFGSFLFGAVFGLSWTPCVGPILVSILILASTATSFVSGGLLLFCYALGLSIPLLLVSVYLGRIDKNSGLWKLLQGKEIVVEGEGKPYLLHTNSLISGLLFIVLGYLIFSGMLFSFNQYVASSSFQGFIFRIEEWLLGLLR